jgi:hypothetical protein
VLLSGSEHVNFSGAALRPFYAPTNPGNADRMRSPGSAFGVLLVDPFPLFHSEILSILSKFFTPSDPDYKMSLK